jgi:glutamate transport system permease protein
MAANTSVLFDVPGPRAKARNRLLGVGVVAVLVAIAGYILYRFNDTGQFDAKKWEIFQYETVQTTLVEAYFNTLKAAAAAAVLAVALGALLAAARLSEHRFWRVPSFAFVELFRAIPLILLMFVFYYGRPGGLHITPFWAVVFSLMLYNGAVFAELFRAGVESVPKGQSEAAYALGMRKTQVMVTVLLPQAVKSMLPSIISQLVVLLKDTALGFLVTYPELLYQVKLLGGDFNYGSPLIPVAIVGGTIYILTCLLLSFIANWTEKRMSRARTSAPIQHAGPTAGDGPTAPPPFVGVGQGGTV